MRLQPRSLICLSAPLALLVPTIEARGQFSVFEGGATSESDWRAAAGGTVPSEDFEGYQAVPSPFSGPSDQVIALPALGIVFASGVPGAYPGVYSNAFQAHSGENQLANFGGGLSAFDNYSIHPEAGRGIFALGFWQCDPQGNQTMVAFDAAGLVVGEITGRINDGSGLSFAGFVSSIPIARVEVNGLLGDGWNHIDDLQVISRSTCTADFNHDGTLNSGDFFDFLTAFFTDAPAADFNTDGTINSQDFFDFIAAFFAGC